MNAMNQLSALRTLTRNHKSLVVMGLLLAILAGCATTQMSPDERSSLEPAVSRLEDGRQGFRIDESVRVDGETLSDFTRAVNFMEQARYDEAIALLKQVIEQSPRLTIPHINIALAYEHTGDEERTEEHLKTALDLIPGHPVASNTYGLFLRKNGRFTEARDIFEMSLDHFPEYLPVRKNLGIVCELYLGDLACALEQFEIYSEVAPEDELITIWIASLRQRIDRQE